MSPGSIVIVHLSQPTEKLWGVLERLAPEGIIVRAINLESFDDWMRSVARRDNALGLCTMFMPMFRVERIFLDEQVGEVESYRQRFLRYVGVSAESHLGLASQEPGEPHPALPS